MDKLNCTCFKKKYIHVHVFICVSLFSSLVIYLMFGSINAMFDVRYRILVDSTSKYGQETPKASRQTPEIGKEVNKVIFRHPPTRTGTRFPNVTCPVKESEELSGFWYNICYSDSKVNYRISYHAIYYDNRNNEIRSVILTFGNIRIPELHCVLWYEKSNDSPQSVKANLISLRLQPYIADEIEYIAFLLICPLQKIKIPSHVSIAAKVNNNLEDLTSLAKTIDNKAELIVPVLKPNTEALCVCLSAQYGDVNDDEAAFFIQWMELLYKFGVNNVVMYNTTIRSKGMMYHKALEHYVNKGMLTLIQAPLPFTIDLQNHGDEFNAVEALRSITVNDCFYRNRLSYWYFIHIDKDEIMIPRKFKTYQEFLKSFLAKNLQEVLTPSLAVPSSFYYKIASKAKKGVPDYFPMLQRVTRQPTEPTNTSPGYSKSFINPKSCSNIWNHRCFKAGDDKFRYVSADDIVLHHYRDSCPEEVLPLIRPKQDRNCDDEPNRSFHDDFIGEHYGEYLRQKTLEALKAINYPI